MSPEPCRGDIWYVNFSGGSRDRAPIGTEMGAAYARPCLIVSEDAFRKRGRVTVVLLTTHSGPKEDTLSRWSASINARQHPSGHYFDVIKQDPDPRCQWHKSIVDCGQLWTVVSTDGRDSNIQWGRGQARLSSELALVNIETGIQVVLGGNVLAADLGERILRFQDGDVLEADLPGLPNQRCLVVSSTGVDFLRENILRRDSRPIGRSDPGPWSLGQITVVPLFDFEGFPQVDDEGIAPVTVGGAVTVAVCQEIYTIDWRARGARGPTGSVSLKDMTSVRRALWRYLDLPG